MTASPSHPVELLVDLDRTSRISLSIQLAAQIAEAIRRGSLKPGTRLPASRMLASELAVSRGVVTAAYAQLTTQGFLEGRSRAVPRVAAVPAASTSRAASPSAALRADFTMLSPDLTLLPRRDWRRTLIEAVQTAPMSAFDYGDPRGEISLRAALSEYLGRTRGVVTTPECVVICQGTVQALDIACQTLIHAGASLAALEDPCAHEVRQCTRRAGLDTLPVAVDRDGLAADVLVSSPADFAITTPAHQFPTGIVLSPQRRAAVGSWLAVHDRYLIEDDYDTEFRYDARPMAAMQSAYPDRVFYIGSASKTFAPGLRLGWLIVPEHLHAVAADIKWSMDAGSPSITQLAFAQMIGSGAFERHLVKARSEYRRRRTALHAALAAELPHGRVEGATAGLHLVLRLLTGIDAAALARSAATARVRVESVESFMAAPPAQAARVVLGYGRLHPSMARNATKALAAVLKAARFESDHRILQPLG